MDCFDGNQLHHVRTIDSITRLGRSVLKFVKEMKTREEKEYVTTLNEGPIAINLEITDSEGNDFEEYKRLEDKVISSQSLEFKIFPIT